MLKSFCYWAFFFLSTICLAQQTAVKEVQVGGLAGRPYTLNLETLKTFPVARMERDGSEWKGVLLRDLIDKAEVELPYKKARGEYYVLVSAGDGYKVIFAWNELYSGPAGNNTWLFFEKDGKPIEDTGRFVLHCTSDLVQGPRHVKWVNEILIKRDQ